jgi:hypothetical protein
MTAVSENVIATDLLKLDRRVRLDVRRHAFKERERLLLGVILDFSLACGRERAVIPRLEDFEELTGISRGNVCTCLKALEGMGVIGIEAGAYRVLPRSELHVWQVRPLVDVARADGLAEELRTLNGVSQGELLAPEPSLKGAVGDVVLAAAVKDSARRAPFAAMRDAVESSTRPKGLRLDGLPKYEAEDLERVPEMRNWSEVMGWLASLEGKHQGWMGTGDADTWCASYGRQWWPRWKQDRKRFERVWNEALSMARERRIKDSIGGTANDLWKNGRLG